MSSFAGFIIAGPDLVNIESVVFDVVASYVNERLSAEDVWFNSNRDDAGLFVTFAQMRNGNDWFDEHHSLGATLAISTGRDVWCCWSSTYDNCQGVQRFSSDGSSSSARHEYPPSSNSLYTQMGLTPDASAPEREAYRKAIPFADLPVEPSGSFDFSTSHSTCEPFVSRLETLRTKDGNRVHTRRNPFTGKTMAVPTSKKK